MIDRLRDGHADHRAWDQAVYHVCGFETLGKPGTYNPRSGFGWKFKRPGEIFWLSLPRVTSSIDAALFLVGMMEVDQVAILRAAVSTTQTGVLPLAHNVAQAICAELISAIHTQRKE